MKALIGVPVTDWTDPVSTQLPVMTLSPFVCSSFTTQEVVCEGLIITCVRWKHEALHSVRYEASGRTVCTTS